MTVYLALFYYQTPGSVYPHKDVVGIFDNFEEAYEAVKKEMEKSRDYSIEGVISGYVYVYEMNRSCADSTVAFVRCHL